MKVDKARGMNVSVVTTAKTDEEGAQAAAVHRHAVPPELRTLDGHDRKDRERSTRRRSSRSGCATACHLCGRPRAYMRKFALCRLCFRKLALEGDVTGVTKSSW
jgi:ribosomal protein S14